MSRFLLALALTIPLSAQASTRWRTVVRVIDAESVVLDGRERVRLIGVDVPETIRGPRVVRQLGREAAAFTRRTLQGHRVRLELGAERRDKDGRTLGYLLRDDGLFLNAEIIRQGYGYAENRFPHPHQARFRALEQEARRDRRGLWAR